MLKPIAFKSKMALGGIAIVMIPFLIAGMIVYFQLSRSLLKLSRQGILHLAEDLAAVVDERLRQEIKLVSSIAAEPVLVQAAISGDYRAAQKSMDSLCKRIGKSNYSIFLLGPNGIVQADPIFGRIRLDLSNRDYFQKARKGQVSVSGPFYSRGGPAHPSKPIVVITAPILQEKKFFGAVTVLLDLNLMTQIISKKKYIKTGYGYIVDAQGLILVHPRKDFILKRNMLAEPGTEEVREVLAGNKTGTAAYCLEGSEKIVGFSPMTLTGWIAAFSQNKEKIMIPANRILLSIFAAGAIYMILTIIGIVLFSNKLGNPVQEVMTLAKLLMNNTSEMILQIGVDRKVTHANDAYERITGHKIKTALHREPILNNMENVPTEIIWKKMEQGSSWAGRVILKTDGQKPVTLDVIIMPLIDEMGTVHGYLEIGRDITAELLAEKRLQQGQKLEAIGTLAGGIAHDFNNILSGIFGYAELGLMEAANNPDKKNECLRNIMRASERARDLVSQILTFSRKTEIKHRPLQLKTVLNESLKLMRASIPTTIKIRLRIESEAVIMADPTQIHQVVMNLFTNAAHAIGNKAGLVELELTDFIVDEVFAQTHPDVKAGSHVLIRISDTGKGIPPDIRNKVFEPFFTTKAQGQGTGLGLSMVHGIVKKLGGTVSVASEMGKGTTFSILFPTTQSDNSEPPISAYTLKGGNARIAVVDDEQDIITILHKTLTKLGYIVTTFTKAQAALEEFLANHNGFDLIVTDYTMPNLTGLEITRHLRGAGINIPIILISGYLDKEIENIARQAGIAEFIAKPIDIYHLAETMQRIINRRAGDLNQKTNESSRTV